MQVVIYTWVQPKQRSNDFCDCYLLVEDYLAISAIPKEIYTDLTYFGTYGQASYSHNLTKADPNYMFIV
jgi:hypothetical protein